MPALSLWGELSMSPRKIEIADEVVAEGKRLYEETLTPLRDLAAFMGISRRTLENRIREWGWRRRRIASRPIELFHAARGAAIAEMTKPRSAPETPQQPVSPELRHAIAQRIQSVVERELAAVEQVLAVLGPSGKADAEQSARTLASIARTLREIAALNRPEQETPPDEATHDPIFIDIDEFREELARRIRSFVDARRIRSRGADGDAAAGTDAGPA